MNDGVRTLTEQDIYQVSSTKQAQYGAVGMAADGRRYRYVGFGGTATIAPGLVVVAPVTTAAYQGLAITATGTGGQIAGNLVAGSTQLILTNGATSVTLDQFAEGYLELLVGGLSGSSSYSLKIRGNTAAGNAGFITVFLYEPLRNTTALVPGTDTANLNTSIYGAANVSATAGVPLGVTVMPVPNTATVTNYGWIQCGGPCDVLNDAGGTITVGGGFAQSVTTAGSVVVSTASAAPIIGYTRKAIAASNIGPAVLNLPA